MEPITVYIILASVVGALLLLFLLYLFLIAPRRRRDLTRIFASHSYAHRGLHGNGVPENSMAAFRCAVENGYGIEFDVQLTKDGVPVIFHDATLKRMCGDGVTGGVVDYTYDELCAFRLDGTDEQIPTLRALLQLVDGRVPLLMEVKREGDYKRTAALADKETRDYRGLLMVESFHPFVIRYFKKARPTCVRGILSMNFSSDKSLRSPVYTFCRHLLFNFLMRPDFIAYHLPDGDALSLRLCRKMGATTFAFTVRTEEELRLAREQGFDSVIFEFIRPKG